MKEMIQQLGIERVGICYGWQTKEFQEKYGLTKDHNIDATVIAIIGANIIPSKLSSLHEKYEAMQFRRHDRARIHSQRERTYYLNGKAVCKNRHKRFEQKDLSLEEYVVMYPEMVAHLTVKSSKRYYNNMQREPPGAVFLYQGKWYILSGQLANGQYYRAVG